MNLHSLKYFAPCLLLLGGCAGDTVMPESSGSIPVKVNVSVPAADLTRTSLKEEGGNLAWSWTDGDRLLVSDAAGNNVGTLSLTEITSPDGSTASFEGNLNSSLANGEVLLNFTYLGKEEPASVGNPSKSFSIASQDGLFDSLKDRDILTSTVKASKTAAYVAIPDFKMSHYFSAGRFALKFAENVEIASVEISGGNMKNAASLNLGSMNWTSTDGSIIVEGDSKDIYVTLAPADALDMTFKAVTADGKKYNGSLGVTFNLGSGIYLRKSLGDGTYAGLPVEMQPEVPETPVDDDTVGPVFDINGKKYKFTKANLAYNVLDKSWYLLDEQWSFLCKKGWAYANGNYYGAKESDIDLFGFGCTGMYFSYFNNRLHTPTQFDEQINAPEYFIQKQLYAGQSINGTQQGYYYPTQNATCNEGYTGSNLEFGIQGFTMDWGVAYAAQQNSGANYFTLLSSEWSELQKNYYMCGATITDVKNPNTNKNGIYGCMILGVKDKDAATAILKEYGATVSGLTNNLSFTGTNYQYFVYSNVKMTSEQFKNLEAAGKVVFLPEAGHTAVTVNSYTKNDGYYWTATAGQAYTSTIFRFDGDSSPKVFKLDSQSSRIFGCAVRLVKEVKE